jgi:gamma-D-glutamyl-L-lysine dipeptidyl-peptidase
MIRSLFFSIVAIGAISSVFSDTQHFTEPAVNMHLEPQELSEVIAQGIYGVSLKILEDNDLGWVKVRSADDYVGWVLKSALLNSSNNAIYPQGEKIAHVKNLYAHVYRITDVIPHPPLMTLPFSTKLEVIKEPSDQDFRWIQIKLLDGSLACIQRGDVSINPKALSLEEMLLLSRQFVGLPYTWGGTTSFGFDCSGFVQMLFGQMGIKIPRSSRSQARIPGIMFIEEKDLLPGDVIFFSIPGQNIGHVGLYLGNDEFIQATPKYNPVIQVSNLKDPKWKSLWTFYPARIPGVQKG